MSSKFRAQLNKVIKDLQFDMVLEDIPDKKRHLHLHPSSFPFCPLKTLYTIAKQGLFTRRWETASSDYYCSVGTAVHTVMQKHFGAAMEVVGDWTCKKCGNVAEFSTLTEAGKCCGKTRHYEELGIKFGKTITGHTDGLFKFENAYWVGDYKTSSVKKIEDYRESGKGLPLVSNREQIRSYVVLLEKKYKIKIVGWVLLYMARDNPFKYSALCFEEFNEILRIEQQEKMVTYNKQYDRMLDITDIGDDLDYLVATKPCKCEADYTELFSSPYSECPLYTVCFQPKKLEKELTAVITHSTFLPMRTTTMSEDIPPKPLKKAWTPNPDYKPPSISEF